MSHKMRKTWLPQDVYFVKPELPSELASAERKEEVGDGHCLVLLKGEPPEIDAFVSRLQVYKHEQFL